MPNNLNNQPFIALKRVAQKNSFYCGPASIQMLLSFYQIEVDQDVVVSNLGIGEKIRAHGMTIGEMGEFVKRFCPQLQFWLKFGATILDLSGLINQYAVPVGVEWQGIFDYPDEEAFEDEDNDPGHIAVVTAIDINKNQILIADPDRHYAGNDREFSIIQFERRWWDINQITDPVTQEKREADDYHGLFIITPQSESFPEKLGLERI